jgi:uncharacterized protein DUF3307
MQPLEIFWIFCLGHLMTDFVLQTTSLVERKKKGKFSAYAQHGLTHYFAILIVAAIFDLPRLADIRFQLTVVALTAMHLGIDWTKLRLTTPGRIPDGLAIFLADQAVHLASITLAVFIYTGARFEEALGDVRAIQAHRDAILAVLVVYVAAVFGAGYIVRYLTKPLLGHLATEGGKTREELRNAGLYIGWLERILVLTAILLRSPSTIGLVLTAKSIVRYPELKDGRFAEYFLIGTLLSILFAIFAGIVLQKLLHQAIGFVS